MTTIDRAEARLENLGAIEPLLGSLRVLSLSTMQMALNRQQSLKEYSGRFLQFASLLRSKPQIQKVIRKEKKQAQHLGEPESIKRDGMTPKRVLAVIGSSRGICGQYNKQLATQTARLLAREEKSADQIEILAFGPRLHNAMHGEGLSFKPGEVLAHGSLPNYARVSQLMRDWEARLAAGEVISVSLLSFKRVGTSGSYKPKLTQLLPDKGKLSNLPETDQDLFPEPIVEGDPAEILARIEKHLNAIQLYDLVLDAIAAENLYRYRLLEEAKENTEELLEELSITLQMERRKAITQQMQQLGVASGMLAER